LFGYELLQTGFGLWIGLGLKENKLSEMMAQALRVHDHQNINFSVCNKNKIICLNNQHIMFLGLMYNLLNMIQRTIENEYKGYYYGLTGGY
jgi:hypothetical protein